MGFVYGLLVGFVLGVTLAGPAKNLLSKGLNKAEQEIEDLGKDK